MSLKSTELLYPSRGPRGAATGRCELRPRKQGFTTAASVVFQLKPYS